MESVYMHVWHVLIHFGFNLTSIVFILFYDRCMLSERNFLLRMV